MKHQYNEIGELILCKNCGSNRHTTEKCLASYMPKYRENVLQRPGPDKKQRPSDNIAYKRITKEIFNIKKEYKSALYRCSDYVFGLKEARRILRESLK